MATLVHLLYRDACNYKATAAVTFAGAPTPELIERLRVTLDGDTADGCIVAEQVGLLNPARVNPVFQNRFPDEEDDHGWVELDCDDITEVLGTPVDERTFTEFVEACETAAADGWDPDIAIEAAGGWQDPEKCAVLRGGSVE